MSSKFQTLICIAIAICPICAFILYDDIKVNIFDKEPRDFELRVSATTAKLKDFFDRHDISLATAAGVTALRLVPYVGKFARLAPMMCETLTDQSEWRKLFTKATVEEAMHEVGESEVRWMEATMQTIQSKIKLLTDNNTDLDNRKTITSIIHTELNRMMNFFDLKSSLFRKYPLIGAPPLLQLASLVAIFAPIAMKLIPLEAKNPQISCKMHDVLLDYRGRVVMARLHQLRSKVASLESLKKRDKRKASLIKVMTMPYEQYGYNITNPPIIDCNWGCDSKQMSPTDACVIDKFSSEVYSGRNIETYTCLVGYAGLVRHHVEKLFPVELLDSLCIDRKPKEATGHGWFTFYLINAYFYGGCKDDDMSSVHLPKGCNPYVKVFVNDELVKQSPTRNDKTLHDVDISFETAKIPKNSTIRFEIWDGSCGIWSGEKFIFSANGTVESFLNHPLRKNGKDSDKIDAVEIMSFWRDEYK